MRPAGVESVPSVTRTEGPHVAATPRRRNILLIALFIPIVGALVAWLDHDWPTWARVIATVWTIIVVFAAIGLATDLFGRREQNPVPHAAPTWVLESAA